MPNPNPKSFFSIIIPCLNEEHFLPLLLQDLTKQSYQDFEVVVIDGHSDDQTQEVIKKFSYVKLLISKKRNVAYQRNLGANKANGEYLLFFDGDNRLPINFLSELHKQIDKNRPDICSTMTITDSSNFINRVMVILGNLFVYISMLAKRPMFAGACICVDKSIFTKLGGFNESLTLSEDHELVDRYVKKGAKCRFYATPKYYFSFRRFEHDGYYKVLYQWLLGLLADLFKTDRIAQITNYEMGGKRYK